jgi:hypothetical protein
MDEKLSAVESSVIIMKLVRIKNLIEKVAYQIVNNVIGKQIQVVSGW